MVKRILVGWDPDEPGRAPALFGAAVSRYTGAPLTVVVVHAASSAFAAVGHDLINAEGEEQTHRRLDGLKRALAAEFGVRAECMSRPGSDPAKELRRSAREFGAGLVVVGSSARGGLKRLTSSPTATRLLHEAPCPVAVVPGSWEAGGGLHTIGAAFEDDSAEAQDALMTAMALGRRAGARVRVITAVDAPEDVAGAGTAARAVAEAGPGPAQVDVDVRVGDPADTLVEASAGMDLLICGSRGVGGMYSRIVGSVSRRVTAEAHCPVIVLARGIQSGLDDIFADRAATPA